MPTSTASRKPSQREHVLVAVLGKFSDASPWMRFAVLIACLLFVLAAITIAVFHPRADAVVGGGSILWSIGRFFDRW